MRVQTTFSGLSSLLTLVLVFMVYGVAVLTGCGGGDDDDNGGDECIELSEREPNNDIDESQILGALQAGDCFIIIGTIFSDQDTFDGQTFDVTGPQDITAILTHSNASDFDLAFFSRDQNEVVAICEEEDSPEICSATFTGNSDTLDIIVVPFSGIGDYTLEITSTTVASSRAAPSSLDPYPDNSVLQNSRDKAKDSLSLLERYLH